MNRPIVVLDTENAVPRGAPHLVEIGAVRVADGEVIEHFSELVRPEVPVDPQTTEVHGITDEDLFEARDAGDVLARFFEWIGQDWLAAHRAQRDAWVLAFEGLRHGLPLPPNPCLDTLGLARRLIPEAPDHKLSTLVQHLELELDGHRALPDAVACWQVLEECSRRYAPTGASAAELLSLTPRPTTIAAQAPRTPRLTPRLRPLEGACREGERVRLHYGDRKSGSDLAWLEVCPRLLYEEGGKRYLEGECQRSGLLKTYRLDRVHKVHCIA